MRILLWFYVLQIKKDWLSILSLLPLGLLLSKLGGIGLVLLLENSRGFHFGFVFCCFANCERSIINFRFFSLSLLLNELGGIGFVLFLNKLGEFHFGFMFYFVYYCSAN